MKWYKDRAITRLETARIDPPSMVFQFSVNGLSHKFNNSLDMDSFMIICTSNASFLTSGLWEFHVETPSFSSSLIIEQPTTSLRFVFTVHNKLFFYALFFYNTDYDLLNLKSTFALVDWGKYLKLIAWKFVFQGKSSQILRW